MKILESEKIYLLWYFSEFEKWETLKLRNQGEDHFDVLAPFWSEAVSWMENENLLSVGKVSFSKNQLSNFNKTRRVQLQTKILKNSFSLKEFHIFNQEYLKYLKTEDEKSYFLSCVGNVIRPEIKISDFTKIKKYLDDYVNILLNEYKTIRDDNLLQMSLILDDKILLDSYKERLIWMYGKDKTETINRELRSEVKDIFTLTIINQYENDYRLFLPSMVYMENKKLILIQDITYDPHSCWYWVEFKILNNHEKSREKNKIWKIECTKVSKANNTFTAYLNEQYDHPINLKRSGSGLILYDVAHSKSFTKKLPESSIKDHIIYLGNRDKGSIIYKEFPEIDSTKILKKIKVAGKISVIAESGIVITAK